jgi:P63C domain
MSLDIETVAFGSEQLPLKIGTISLSCYLLDNNQRVFTKTGIQKALGYDGKSEDWLLDLLTTIDKFSPIAEENIQKYQNPILIAIHRDGIETIVENYDCFLVLTLCNIIIDAKNDGFLNVNQLRFAKNAETILETLSSDNIVSCIDEATGFVFFKEQSKDFLRNFLFEKGNDAAFLWIKTFPDAFFEILFYLNQLDWKDLKENPLIIGKIIHEVVFSRQSDEIIQELRANKPKRSYKRKQNYQQDNEHPALKEFISNCQSLMKASGYQWNIFIQFLNKSYPKNSNYSTKFPLLKEEIRPIEEPVSFFNTILLKGVHTI